MAGQNITIKLFRGDASPWGFRLQGGKDWAIPLSVSKVNPGSLSDQAGLQLGDYLIKINGAQADIMRHKEAQDSIVACGNNIELVVQRGGTTTWKPQVTPVGTLPRPSNKPSAPSAPVTKTSLAKIAPEPRSIGSGHNVAAKPFGAGSVTALVHNRYNSPINIYSMNNIAQTIQAHTEMIAPGVKGINFMKPDAPVNKESAVYRLIQEEELSKGDYYDSHEYHGGSPQIQSQAFRRLQYLDGEDPSKHGGHSPGISSPRVGFPPQPHSPKTTQIAQPPLVTRKVEAPITKPAAERQESQQNQNTCADCGRLIVGVFCRVNNKNFHAECFKCSTCGTSLKNVGYFNINDKLYCDVHAQQAARTMAPNNQYDPVAVRPGAPLPKDAEIVGFGTPTNMPTKISIPPPSMMPQCSGKLSPSVVGAMPWHQPGNYHHVEAPASPGASLLQTATPFSSVPSSVPPPVAPKPQFKAAQPTQSSVQPPWMSRSAHPYTGPVPDAHRPIPGGSKFTWPPKGDPQPQQIGTPGTPIQAPFAEAPKLANNAAPSHPGYRPSSGTQQHINYDSSKLNDATTSATSFSATAASTFASSSSFSEMSTTNISNDKTNLPALAKAPGQSGAAAPLNNDISEISNAASASHLITNTVTQQTNTISQNIHESEKSVLVSNSSIFESKPINSNSAIALPGASNLNNSNASPATTPSTPSSQYSSVQSTKIPPPTLPKPSLPCAPRTGTANIGMNSGPPQSSGPTPSTPGCAPGYTPGPGQSSVPGSRPAPRRGRGQLKPQATPGTRIPICAVCGTPIRGPFIVALGKTWCLNHFNCANAQCKRSLEDTGFVEEQGQLYCENCFEAYLAPICAKCNVRIKGDCLVALDKQWHPECFICSYCNKAFGNNSFYLEDGMPYCEKDWNELFTTKCVNCGFPIEAGDRWVEALNNNYHSQCFKCTVCKANLEGQSFYAKGGKPYCKSHAR